MEIPRLDATHSTVDPINITQLSYYLEPLITRSCRPPVVVSHRAHIPRTTSGTFSIIDLKLLNSVWTFAVMHHSILFFFTSSISPLVILLNSPVHGKLCLCLLWPRTQLEYNYIQVGWPPPLWDMYWSNSMTERQNSPIRRGRPMKFIEPTEALA